MSMFKAFAYRPAIHIIPSDDVPNGRVRISGLDVFVSPWNYELMRPLSAHGTLMLLAHLMPTKSARNEEE